MEGKVVPLSLVPLNAADAASVALAYMREALQVLDDNGTFTIVGAQLSGCIDQLERLAAASGQ